MLVQAQPRIPGRLVGDQGDRPPERRVVARRAAEHGYRPGHRPVQPGQAGQQRRLAGAVDPGHGDDLAAGHSQVHVLEHHEAAVAHPHAAHRHRRPSHSLTVSPRPTSRGRWHPGATGDVVRPRCFPQRSDLVKAVVESGIDAVADAGPALSAAHEPAEHLPSGSAGSPNCSRPNADSPRRCTRGTRPSRGCPATSFSDSASPSPRCSTPRCPTARFATTSAPRIFCTPSPSCPSPSPGEARSRISSDPGAVILLTSSYVVRA